jgi:hypothetical protein
MTVIHEFLRKLESINLNQLLSEVFNEAVVQQKLIDLNKFDQLFKGVDANNRSLGSYAPSTVQIKREELSEGVILPPQSFDNIILRHTGAFWDSIYVDVKRNEIVFKGDTDKGMIDLIREYGKDILGLSDQSIEKIQPLLKNKLIEKINTKLSA